MVRLTMPGKRKAAPAPVKTVPARRSFRTLALIAYTFLTAAMLILYLVYQVHASGWLGSSLLLVISVALQFWAARKGCVTGFSIFLVTVALLMITFMLTIPD